LRPKLKWWRDSIKIKAQKIVREMVEEQKQKEVVKQKELQGLLNRYGATLEDTKEQKQHLREENERLKQELRTVKIQLSKQPASACAWRTVMHRKRETKPGCLCIEYYQSTDRCWLQQGSVSFAVYWR